jgi:hypothetical protein
VADHGELDDGELRAGQVLEELKVRSTIQRFGTTTKPVAASDRLTISGSTLPTRLVLAQVPAPASLPPANHPALTELRAYGSNGRTSQRRAEGSRKPDLVPIKATAVVAFEPSDDSK